MASDKVVTLTDDNFQQEVIESDQPVLVDFWAEWCMPCKMLAPTIDDLAGEYDGRLKVGKVDTDSNRETALKHGISAIPTVMLFKGGQVVKRFVGLQAKKEFKQAIDANL